MIKSNKHGERYLVCDLCNGTCDTSETTATDARFQAKGWGWTRRAGQDLCDCCRAAEYEKHLVHARSHNGQSTMCSASLASGVRLATTKAQITCSACASEAAAVVVLPNPAREVHNGMPTGRPTQETDAEFTAALLA